MKTLQYSIYLFLLSFSALLFSQANAATNDPQQLVQQTTEQVLAIIKTEKNAAQKNPQQFIAQVTGVMDKVVDFDNFARGVMGSYAGERRYQSLKTDAEKAAFRERIKNFSNTFKQGLIDTYANGLMNFNGQKIETLPLKKTENPASGTATVIQNIYNDSNKPYVVQYTLRHNEAGEWKLQNLIIEGVNLGLTYRSQFSASAELYKGDLDKVIANWKVEPTIDTGKTPSKNGAPQ